MWAIGGRIVGSLAVLMVVSVVLFVLVHTIPGLACARSARDRCVGG